MNAKRSSKSRAFAARSGTWSSSTVLASPGTRTTSASQGFSRGVDPTDEAGGDLAEGQLVAALYALAVYGCAIEKGPVGGAEILDDEAVVCTREPRVPPRDVRVGDDDVVLLRAADGPRSAPVQRVGLLVEDQLHHLPRQPVPPGLLGRDGRRALAPAGILGAEDAGLARGVLRGAFLARAVPARQLCGDPELAETQGILGLEADPGRGHEVVVLVVGV